MHAIQHSINAKALSADVLPVESTPEYCNELFIRDPTYPVDIYFKNGLPMDSNAGRVMTNRSCRDGTSRTVTLLVHDGSVSSCLAVLISMWTSFWSGESVELH